MHDDQGEDTMKGDKGQGNNTKSDKSMVPGHEDKVQGPVGGYLAHAGFSAEHVYKY